MSWHSFSMTKPEMGGYQGVKIIWTQFQVFWTKVVWSHCFELGVRQQRMARSMWLVYLLVTRKQIQMGKGWVPISYARAHHPPFHQAASPKSLDLTLNYRQLAGEQVLNIWKGSILFPNYCRPWKKLSKQTERM